MKARELYKRAHEDGVSMAKQGWTQLGDAAVSPRLALMDSLRVREHALGGQNISQRPNAGRT